MVVKIFLKFFCIFIIIVFFCSLGVFAQDIDEKKDVNLQERIQLIQASKGLSEEAKNSVKGQSGISLYVTNYHSGEKELNLGGKFEDTIMENWLSDNIRLGYVIEGIYLEDEDINLAGFLSFKTTLVDKLFSPYIGIGAEFMGKADYQGFVGLNLTDFFFIETKFINNKDEFDSGEFYSVSGFKISF